MLYLSVRLVLCRKLCFLQILWRCWTEGKVSLLRIEWADSRCNNKMWGAKFQDVFLGCAQNRHAKQVRTSCTGLEYHVYEGLFRVVLKVLNLWRAQFTSQASTFASPHVSVFPLSLYITAMPGQFFGQTQRPDTRPVMVLAAARMSCTCVSSCELHQSSHQPSTAF